MVDIKDTSELQIQPSGKEQNGNIIGEVVLGNIDPRTLSKKEFEKSPHILYHGAAKAFVYSYKGEYDWKVNTFGDTWADYGKGIYTTDNLDQAKNYSRERSKYLPEEQKPQSEIVYTFLPYQARMLNVRDKNNPEITGVLSTSFVKDWVNYLEAHLLNDDNFTDVIPQRAVGIVKQGIKQYFLDRVKKALEENQQITIRGNFKSEPGIFLPQMSGLIEEPFRNFMISKGYDGMIYREGGEGEGRENLTGHVFYNPEVLDTWEGWQERATSPLSSSPQ